jgi:hypothetical protein
MTVFAGAVDATFAAFGIDALYAPASGEPVPVRVIATRPKTIVGFGETPIHAETVTFEMRASEAANPRPDDQLAVARRPDRPPRRPSCAARSTHRDRLIGITAGRSTQSTIFWPVASQSLRKPARPLSVSGCWTS